MKKLLFSLLLSSACIVLVSCEGKDKKDDDEGYEDMTLAGTSVYQLASYNPSDSTRSYGKAITGDGAVNINNLAANPDKANGYTGKVTGVVTSVCQNKGCWMTLDTGNGKSVMVTFKDYGFFVPKDITGKTVVMDGKAELRTVSIDEQKHLAGDAGKSQSEIDKITTSKQELRFEADGVLVN